MKIIDAYALTTRGELLKIYKKILGTVLILFMFFYNFFSLPVFFIYHYLVLIFLIFFASRLVIKNNIPLYSFKKLGKEKFNQYTKEFYKYSAPLITCSLFALFIGIFDRWILQEFSGSIQQGFYQLSFSIGTVCFIFTSAMTPLFLREFSIAYKELNIEKMRRLFSTILPRLYIISAFFAVFFTLYADKITIIIGGDNFKGAKLATAIMILYPIHQTYGQLSGSVFFATENIKLYRNIGIIFMLISIPLVFFFIAPKSLYGLNMGASGLAIKMVLVQFFAVNVQLWYNCKNLNISFNRLLWHQFYSVAILSINAFVSFYLCDLIFKSFLISFLISGIVYTLLSFLTIYLFPNIISMKKEEIRLQVKRIITKLSNKA